MSVVPPDIMGPPTGGVYPGDLQGYTQSTPVGAGLPGGAIGGTNGGLPEPQATIVRVAQEIGVDPNLALAIAYQESGFNSGAIGDGGHSVGLFQLNDYGEGAGMTVAQRTDPETNARIALTEVKAIQDAHPDWTPGQIAVGAQRPAESVRAGYIANVDSMVQQSGGDVNYFSKYAGGSSPTAIGGSGLSPLGPTGIPDNPQQWLQDHYADVAPYMQIPDLANIITQAAQNNWSSDQIRGALEASNWWKQTSDTARNWQELQGSQPAEAARQLAAKRQDIIQLAEEKGISLTGQDLDELSSKALENGWDTNILLGQLVGKMTSTNVQPGAAMTSEADLTKISKDWGIPLSDPEMLHWMQGIAQGTLKTQDLTASLQQRAQTMYGSNQALSDAIQKGISPGQFFAPYAQVAQNELGLPVDSINWQDPKWLNAMNYTDPKTGVARPMNVSEWQQTIRSDPQYGWKFSDTANSLAGDLEKTLTTTFGAIK